MSANGDQDKADAINATKAGGATEAKASIHAKTPDKATMTDETRASGHGLGAAAADGKLADGGRSNAAGAQAKTGPATLMSAEAAAFDAERKTLTALLHTRARDRRAQGRVGRPQSSWRGRQRGARRGWKIGIKFWC